MPAAGGAPAISGDYKHLSELTYDYDWENAYSPGHHTYHAIGDPDVPIVVSLGWCSTTQIILDENWSKMGYELTIDGFSIDLEKEMAFRSWTIPPEIGPCYGYFGLTKGWRRGEHYIIWTHTIYQSINDGVSDFKAGDYVMETILNIP